MRHHKFGHLSTISDDLSKFQHLFIGKRTTTTPELQKQMWYNMAYGIKTPGFAFAIPGKKP